MGAVKICAGRAAFDHLAFVQNGDALAYPGDRGQIVGDIEDRHAGFAIQTGKELQDFGLRDDVEGAGGFIGDEERGAVHDGHGDQHTLGLANAKLGGALAQEILAIII